MHAPSPTSFPGPSPLSRWPSWKPRRRWPWGPGCNKSSSQAHSGNFSFVPQCLQCLSQYAGVNFRIYSYFSKNTPFIHLLSVNFLSMISAMNCREIFAANWRLYGIFEIEVVSEQHENHLTIRIHIVCWRLKLGNWYFLPPPRLSAWLPLHSPLFCTRPKPPMFSYL